MDQEIELKTLKTTELDLSGGFFLDIPKNIVFPNELNQYLKEQLQLHLHENGILQKKILDLEGKLHENQAKNDEFRKKIRDYEILSGKNEFISSTAVATNKIVELSRKVREKTSELEVYKTKCSKLEHRVFQLKEEINNIQHPDEPEKTPKNELEEQVKQLQEKLNGVKNKLLETKNQNVQLKNDLKLANKWLQQETGENFDCLSNIHSTSSNWRGRAQIICDLQKKNSDLREKLKNTQEKGLKSVNVAETKLDKKIETLTKENSELKNQLDEFKKKFDGARARTKYLDGECVALKNKISKLSTEIDDKRQEISSLTAQLTIEKRFKNESQKQRETLVIKFQEDTEKLKIELEKKDCAIQNLTKQLDERGEEMNVLRNKIRGSRPPSSYGKKSDIQISSEDKIVINRLEAERQKLLELTELQNKRLDTERNQHQKTELELRHERQRAAKLEANLARLELEFSSKSSTYSLNTTHRDNNDYDVLKNQLELAKENIETLQTRLEVEKHERKIDLHQFASILQMKEN